MDAVFDLHDNTEEARIAFEHGDFLAVTTIELWGHPDIRPRLPWFIPSQDWTNVETELKKEEREREDGVRGPKPYPAAIQQQADKRRITFRCARYQIRAYTARNKLAHSGVGTLIDTCNWVARWRFVYVGA